MVEEERLELETQPFVLFLETHKGVYEKHPGSGIWWIRYTKDGRRLTESIGSHSDAVKIIQQRTVEIRKGVRLSSRSGQRGTKFAVLVTDAISYSNRHHKDKRNFKQRLELANEEFGGRTADSITPQEIADWLEDMEDAREWEAATGKRVKAAISKAYKLGMMNSKVHTNPARLVSSKKENPGRLRFVSDDEEIRLRKVIAAQRPHCMYQYDVAVHTGMRKGEQFTVTWVAMPGFSSFLCLVGQSISRFTMWSIGVRDGVGQISRSATYEMSGVHLPSSNSASIAATTA